MTDIISITSATAEYAPISGTALAPVLPAVRVENGVRIRPAVADDLPFIDALQKMHTGV